MEHLENIAEETRDVSVTAILGGVLSLTSPLVLLSDKMLFLPIMALLLISAAFVSMAVRRQAMIGRKIAIFGLYFSLFFIAAGWVSAKTFRNCEVESAKHFASQWFQLMTTGRQLEALQLENPRTHRARGAGVLLRYTTEKSYIESYEAFMKNDAVRCILREFQGGEIHFVKLENITFSRRLTSYFVVFELAKGEGLMRKSRQFRIQIAAAKEYPKEGERGQKRYEWTTRIVEVL